MYVFMQMYVFRQKKWKKFIVQWSYGYYVPNENPGEKSVIEPTQIMPSTEDISKNSVYKMEINNGVGNMRLSEDQEKVSKVPESTGFEKRCDENMTGLQNFNKQEPIRNVKR